MCGLITAPPRVAAQYLVGGHSVRQPLQRKLSQCLQQPEAAAKRPGLYRDHRPLHEVAQEMVGVHGVLVGIPGNRLGRAEVKGPGEHRQPLEQPSLRGREQVVGPLHGGSEGAMPLGARPSSATQQAQAAVKPGQQL